VRTTAPSRHTEGPDIAFLEEQSLAVTGLRASEPALPDAPAGTPLLSRLRVLHERFLPRLPYLPLNAEWTDLDGAPAVLDYLGLQPGGVPTAFSISADLGDGRGAVAFGSAPASRSATLTEVAVPLAKRLSAADDRLTWVLPAGWSWSEELQLVSETAIARVRLEPMPPGWGLAEWTRDVFARAPFLRDLRPLGDREVTIPGVAGAQLSRFDWQPPGQPRVLTNVVTGLTGRDGFSLVLEIPFEFGPEFHTMSPDAVLGMVSVATDGARTPTPTVAVAPDAEPPAVPTAPARSEPDPRLIAPVDRTVVACVDVADGLRPLARAKPPAYDEDLGRADVTTMSTTVTEIVSTSSPEQVLHRLACWAAGAPGFNPSTSQRPQRALLLGGRATAVEMLMAAARFAGPDPAVLARRWADTILADDASVTDAFWASAFLVSETASDPFEGGDPDSLVAVLHAASDRLETGPRLAWSRDLAGTGPVRPRRYRLRMFFDAGSGVLTWSGNPATVERFDYPVDHHWLPISKALADAIEELVVQYDEGSGLLRGDSEVFTDDDWAVFRRSYLSVVDELAWQLGSAYEVHDESRFPRA
jgi:hypothetical protein